MKNDIKRNTVSDGFGPLRAPSAVRRMFVRGGGHGLSIGRLWSRKRRSARREYMLSYMVKRGTWGAVERTIDGLCVWFGFEKGEGLWGT